MFVWNSLARDSKNYYGFVVDELSKLMHTIKSQWSLSEGPEGVK